MVVRHSNTSLLLPVAYCWGCLRLQKPWYTRKTVPAQASLRCLEHLIADQRMLQKLLDHGSACRIHLQTLLYEILRTLRYFHGDQRGLRAPPDMEQRRHRVRELFLRPWRSGGGHFQHGAPQTPDIGRGAVSVAANRLHRNRNADTTPHHKRHCGASNTTRGICR